MWVNKVERR
jgi:hypothetical protein